jgi:hypothetical protein
MFTSTGANAESPITAVELINRTPLKKHLSTLEKGEIVIISRPDKEIDTELEVFMSVLIPAPLDKTIDVLQRQSNGKNALGVISIREITDSDSASDLAGVFDEVAFSPSESDEVEQLMTLGPGDDYNFSRKEIASFNYAAENVKVGTAGDKEMAAAMREVLKNRHQAYLKNGLEGVAPYQISKSEQASPAGELIAATDSVVLVKEKFPDYYSCLRSYPKCDPADLVHQFFWAKQNEGDRPLFALKHWILDIQPGHYAMITERYYYMSHSLNSLQVVIGCLPYKNSTLVVLLNQAFTEKVNVKIGKRVAKKVGRTIVENKIRPMFENLRSEFGK